MHSYLSRLPSFGKVTSGERDVYGTVPVPLSPKDGADFPGNWN